MMLRRTKLIQTMLMGLFAATTIVSCGAAPEHVQTAGGVLEVDQFMRGTAQYKDPVTVRGVVSAVHADEQLFTLIDVREYQECGVTNCASLYLPVRWSGAPPMVQEAVNVHGRVDEIGGKLVFHADAMTKSSIPQKSP